MSTTVHDARSSSPTPRYRMIGALILAASLSFLLGRGTALASRHASPPPQPQAASAPAARTAPWAEDGFRDGEDTATTCVTPDCNG